MTEPTRTRPVRRRHPATGARIVAAGIGASTMFALVAAMGVANPFAGAGTGAATTPTASSPLPAASSPAPAPTPAAADVPVALTARPEVRVIVPATPTPTAPVATTRGSS